MPDCSHVLVEALREPANGWSVGTFGAVGEFTRDRDEPCTADFAQSSVSLVTARGGIHVLTRLDVAALAYETFSGDGETWGNTVAFCLPQPARRQCGVIRSLGPDEQALRTQDRAHRLFDLGVGVGHVTMCVRSADLELVAALEAAAGHAFMSAAAAGCAALILAKSPQRVLLSPLARIEVYAPIPPRDGRSPMGPHTHLLPKLIASGRTHSANAPITAGLQPVLTLHPHSPWRDSEGRRTPYDAAQARSFDALLQRFGLPEDRRLRDAVTAAVREGRPPESFPEPVTRHGRMQLRIILRRLAQELGPPALAGWRAVYDSSAADSGEAAA